MNFNFLHTECKRPETESLVLTLAIPEKAHLENGKGIGTYMKWKCRVNLAKTPVYKMVKKLAFL